VRQARRMCYTDPPRMKVLLVEDDASIREGMTELVSELAEATAAGSVVDALALLQREKFELVVTDLRIAGDRDGGRKVVAAARDCLTPVAIISASTYEEIRRFLGENPPDEILMKPFQLEDLLSLTDRFLERRREVDRLALQCEAPDGSCFTEIRAGMREAKLGASDRGQVRWIRFEPGACVEFVPQAPELWVLVEGDLVLPGARRGPGTSLHLAQRLPVRFTSPAGGLALSLVSGA
jgi:CheY-like chemotaxis protein